MTNPAVESWLLAFPYLVVVLVFLFMAWATGGFFYALAVKKVASEPRPWYYHVAGMGLFFVVMRIAAGLALFSWVGTVLGVAGVFQFAPVLCALVPVILGGWYVGGRFAPTHRIFILRDQLWAGTDWMDAGKVGRRFFGLFLFVFSGIAVNAVIGSMVWDMNHDPMWYHLPIPQQWVFAGRYIAMPSSLQSAYTLSGESLFALIFLVHGNAVMCNLLVAICGITSLGLLCNCNWAVATGCRNSTADANQPRLSPLWGTASVLGIYVPLMVSYGLVAPVQPKNDMILYLWVATGTMALLVPLLACDRVPAKTWWLVSGFLLGTALCAKLTLLSMAVFYFFFCITWSGGMLMRSRQKWVLSTALLGCTFLVGMMVAMLPWITRGWLYTGVPLYPLGTSYFHLLPQYEALDKSLAGIQAVPDSNWQFWLVKLQRFPARLLHAASNGEKLFFVYLVLVLVGVLCERGKWRWYSITLMLHCILPLGFTGSVEVFRFFSPSHFMVALLFGRLVSRGVPLLRPSSRYVIACLAWLCAMASFAELQFRTATTRTMRWEFRPVLSEKDRNHYATFAEKGFTYMELGALRSYVQPTERVLLLGYNYPFYLHRDTLWNDEAIGEGGLADRWNGMSPGDVRDFLRDERIDVILIKRMGNRMLDSKTAGEAVAAGVIIPSPLSEELEQQNWEMYRPGE